MYSKELIERVEELANVYSKVIASLDSKERKIEMFESYYKIIMTLQQLQTSEAIQREGFRK
jgi:flagellar biosynthesis chaperone FliJ